MIVALPALVTFGVALLAAALLLGVSLAPGWRDHRVLSLAFLAAALFGLTEVGSTMPLPVGTQLVVGQLALACAVVHAFAWSLFLAARAGASRLDVGVRLLLGVSLVAIAVPGLVYRPELNLRPIVATATTYQDLEPGPLGAAVFCVLVLAHAWLALRAAQAARRGDPAAGLHALAFSGVALCGLLDWLGTAGLHGGPNVTVLALLGLVGSTGAQAVLRLVNEARRRERLASELDVEVHTRATALAKAQANVARAARLQALGELASGVAEEIEGPARRVEGAISELRRGGPLEAKRALVPQARRDVARITALTRQLVAASHAASRAATAEPVVPIAAMARAAVEALRAELPAGTTLRLDVAEELVAAADGDLVQPALAALLARASRSIARRPAPGTITIRALRAGDVVRLEVGDDGPVEEGAASPLGGRSPTSARGLGLPASIGLLRAVGGDLELVRSDAQGTLFALRLPASRPAE